MAVIAKSTRWSCKFSGLVTEAGADWTLSRLKPFADHLLATFGPGRVLWGSDWPVVNLAGGYAAWLEATLALLPPPTHAAILGPNAAAFYDL